MQHIHASLPRLHFQYKHPTNNTICIGTDGWKAINRLHLPK